jgi:hypothetical protein
VRISSLVVYILMTSSFARASNIEDYFSRMRERSLAWLVGKFDVIGSEPATDKTYEGFIVVSRQGDRLFIKKTINGEVTTGIGRIRFEPETPVLEVAFNEKEGQVIAGYEFRCGDNNQPRASAFIAPVGDHLTGRERLGLEVWYRNRPAPGPSPNQAWSLFVKDDPESDDLVGLYEGKYRIIGEDTETGRLYTGTVRLTRKRYHLQMKRSVEGKVSSGELGVDVSRKSKSVLIARCRLGNQAAVSVLNVQGVAGNYPRICGYFYPLDASGNFIPGARPTLETWFFD